jgi:signal transduction histidine kinase
VLDNLLTNAREASRVGDVVTVRAGAGEGGAVRLEVQDEGPGVPPAIAATLFEPFVTAGKEGGSGLGLAISRKIVEDHGAAQTQADAPAKGACFRIELPGKLRAKATGNPEREEVGAS